MSNFINYELWVMSTDIAVDIAVDSRSIVFTMQMVMLKFFFANKLCFLQVQLQFPREILQFHPQILKTRGV